MSTASLSDSTRTALAKAQARMAEAQEELSTGRHADVGRTLGYKTAQTISLRGQLSRYQAITDTNGLLEPRLNYAQTALQGVSDSAGTFMNAIVAASASAQGAVVAQRAGEDALRAFTTLMNTSYDGVYIFSGINTDVEPVADYFGTPASANKVAADAAFLAEFGFAQDDPAAATISASAMQTFLDGAFANLFDAASWSGTWSGASDQNVRSRISTNEMIETSTNANEEPVRKLARAFTMLADLGVDNLNDQTRAVVFDAAMRLTAEGTSGINGMRAQVGLSQERTALATERMSIQMDIISTHVGKLESVDPAEVSVRVTALMTQI
ncbi:MAG: flagellar hook-associated family protein, partial [Hyphomicrobium sp.]